MIDRKPLRLIVFVLIVLLSMTFLIVENYARSQFERISNETSIAELNDVIQIMRDRADPDFLISESLYEVIRGIERIDTTSTNIIESRIKEIFPPNSVRYALFDKEMNIVANSGFSDDMKSEIATIIRDIRWEEDKHEPYDALQWQRAQEVRMRMFQKTFRRYETLNHLFVRPITMYGNQGYLMFGSLYPKSFQSHLLRSHYIIDSNIPPGLPPDGSICCFVSRNLAYDLVWLLKRYAARVPEIEQAIVIIDERSNIVPFGIDEVCVQQIRSRVSSATFGIIEDERQIVGFLKLIQIAPDKIALFPVNRRSISHTGTSSTALAILWLLWILCMRALLLQNTKTFIDLSLADKGAVLLMIAGLLPTIGLYWSYRSLLQWQQVIAVSHGYAQLERKLLDLENRQERNISKIVTEIQRFLEHPMWSSGTYTEDKIASLTAELNKCTDFPSQIPIRPNIVHREKGTLFVAARAFNLTENPSETGVIDLIEHLLKALQHTFAPASDDQAMKIDNMKASVYLEAVQAFLGASNLYRLAMSTDRIVGHRILGSTIWSYLHLFRDDQKKVLMSFFITLERKGMQRRQIYELSEEQRIKVAAEPRKLVSEYVFGLHMQGDFIILPDFMSRIPVLQHIVRRRAVEGGMQRLRMTVAGKQFLLLARPLRGFDYIGMVTVPVDEISSALSILTPGLAFFFPLILIPTMWLLARQYFLAPIATLTQGVESIASGNYDFRLPLVSDDELGDLCRSFNNMAQGLKEKEFMSRFLSDLTLDAVRRGERRLATRARASILFSDIRSFTTLCEAHSGEEIVDMLNEYLTLMEDCIERHGGSIDKFIGDAIMAVFLPILGKPDPALRAVEAAADMRVALAQFNQSRETAGKFTIKTGIGIASGEILMGTLGGNDRQEFTVTGMTVNRATAMEKLSKQATSSYIVLCPSTAERVAETRRLIKIAPENKSASTEGYELLL